MDENLQSKIRENLVARRSGQFRLLADLIKTPSETLSAAGAGAGADMAAISELTLKALKDLEFGIECHPLPDDAPGVLAGVTNLVVRHEFAAGPVVALVAHGDTVAAGDGWTVDPFGAEIRDGVLYGLGVLTKADFTVYAHALAALRDARPDLSGTVELHFTFDGEAEGEWGPKWLLDKSIVNPDYALGSGSAYAIGTSSTGDLQLRVEFEPLAGSAKTGNERADPMQAASRVLDALYKVRDTYADIPSDIPGIGSPALVIGQIEGGERPDAAPGRVALTLDRRLIPDEDPVAVERELTGLIAAAANQIGGVLCRIDRLKLFRPMTPGPGTDTLASVLERQASAATGAAVAVYGVPQATDPRHYAAVGIPSMLYGAGPPEGADGSPGAHPGGPDERLMLDDLRKATEAVALTLGEFMTPAG